MATKTLKSGLSFTKATLWDGEALKGEVLITRKIDGVRSFRDLDGVWRSRASKPLYNLDHINAPIGSNFEIYRDNWEDSVSLVRTQLVDTGVQESDLYRLDILDPRLILETVTNPTAEYINEVLERQRALGDEGLVLYVGKKTLKVKPEIEVDVRVTGIVEGKGKFKGMMGLLTTDHGNVGTGFSTKMRAQMWANYTNEPVTWTYIDTEVVVDEKTGKRKKVKVVREVTEQPNAKWDVVRRIIQASFMEATPAMKMRHPRFQKVRWDKDDENISALIGYESEE